MGSSDFRATMDPHPAPLNRNDLKKRFDVLVFYDMVQEITEKQKKTLLDWAESGKGIVVLHHALVNYQGQDWWREIAGAQYDLKTSKYVHDRKFTAEPAMKHPVLEGVGRMEIIDETYKGMWFSPDIQVLLTTTDETSDRAVAWISPYKKARVVTIQLGHGREAHENPAFRRLVHNAIQWVAGRK
jgi:type 1 glutamine amidotransferase